MKMRDTKSTHELENLLKLLLRRHQWTGKSIENVPTNTVGIKHPSCDSLKESMRFLLTNTLLQTQQVHPLAFQDLEIPILVKLMVEKIARSGSSG